MNPQLLRVTNRIIERSRETRSAYPVSYTHLRAHET